jgi:hypothetical protein
VEENGVGLKAGTPEQFLKSQFGDQSPVFSPDGKWLAYRSNASSQQEVYVRAFPDNGSLWKLPRRTEAQAAADRQLTAQFQEGLYAADLQGPFQQVGYAKRNCPVTEIVEIKPAELRLENALNIIPLPI